MMRNRRFTIILLSTLLFTLAAAFPIQAQSNLLTNPGFENVPNYVPFGRNDFTIAPGWGGWWTPAPRTESWMNIEPIAFPESRGDFRRDGAFSQNIGRGQGTFTAALYQTVPNIAPGTTLRFSVDVLHLNVSESGSQTRVGIGTGTNPQDPNIVWSPWNRTMQAWANVAVEATVAGPAVTVFIYSTQTFPNDSNQNFYDAASLIVTGQGEVPADPNQPPPPPTQPPVSIAAFVDPQGNVVDGRVVHTVQPGDTLAAIAVAYGLTIDEIRARNNLTDAFLQIGQQLVIREAPAAPAEPTPAEVAPPAEGSILEPVGSEAEPSLTVMERVRIQIDLFRRGPAAPGRLSGSAPAAPVVLDPPAVTDPVVVAPPTTEALAQPTQAEPAVVAVVPTTEAPAQPTQPEAVAPTAEQPAVAAQPTQPEAVAPTAEQPAVAAQPTQPEAVAPPVEPTPLPPVPALPAATSTDAPPAPVQEGISADPTTVEAAACVLLFEDRDQNRIQSPDEGLLAGGLIVLRDANNQELSSYETTGTEEPFCFERLAPGRYTAQANAPTGYGLTTPGTLVVSVQAGQRFQITFGAAQGVASASVPTPDGVGISSPDTEAAPEEESSLSGTLRDLAGLLVIGLALVVLVVGGIIAFVARRL